ncbi:MAG: LacI family DNA-binding transcriptional regulator [Opitutus sp.]
MPRPATLQDVANKTGVHRSTVSLALREHASIPPATRARIKSMAEELGYRANPLVTALMKSRRTGLQVKHAVLAYVTNHSTRFGWRPPELEQPNFFPGAVERAKDFGFKLEHFWMAEPGMRPERFGDILRARGIHGIMVGRLPVDLHRLELDWGSFSCVALGLTLEAPKLHHVAENHFFTTRHSMQQCIARGYHRIGFGFTTPNDYPRVGDRWIGGYVSQQRRLAVKDRIPIYEGDPTNQREFLTWFKRYRPDAVLVSRASPVIKWLRDAGVHVPGDVGIVELRNEQPELGHSGVYHMPEKIGALAVETLLGLIHRGERGIPGDPHEVLLAGTWLEGTTLPRRKGGGGD